MAPTATILIVDDEPGVRFFLEEVLSRDGHHVVAVDGGEAALAAAAGQHLDLALVDLKLKGMAGTELLAALRAASPDTALIVITGHASLESAVQALRHGTDDYLFKPVKPPALREAVDKALARQRQQRRQQALLSEIERSLSDSLNHIRTAVHPHFAPAPPASPLPAGGQIECGGLSIDPSCHEAYLDGHPLDLSATEFAMLAYLAAQAPRVVTPQELVRQAQGYDSGREEARDLVSYHIYRLRQKIKAATGRSDVLETVRGVGYKIT